LEIGFPAASKKHMRKIHVFLKIKAGENWLQCPKDSSVCNKAQESMVSQGGSCEALSFSFSFN
jgi:hypothetical protein